MRHEDRKADMTVAPPYGKITDYQNFLKKQHENAVRDYNIGKKMYQDYDAEAERSSAP